MTTPEAVQGLGAQRPPAGDDEVPDLVLEREMDDEEVAAVQRDCRLISQVAKLVPYTAAVAAVGELEDLLDQLADGPLSNRARRRVASAGEAVAARLLELPGRLIEMAEQLGELDQDRLDELKAEADRLRQEGEYRLGVKLDQLAPKELQPARALLPDGEELLDVAIGRSGVWTEPEGPAVLGVRSVARAAVAVSQILVAVWLKAHRAAVERAAQRLKQLASDVFVGAPLLLRFEVIDGAVRQARPQPLPLADVEQAAYAVWQAERMLNPREGVAERGVGSTRVGLELLTALQDDVIGDQIDTGEVGAIEATNDQAADHGKLAEQEADGDEEEEGAAPAISPIDLLAHARAGAARLEQEWAEATLDETVEQIVAEWTALLSSALADLSRRDQAGDAVFLPEYPASAEIVGDLILDGTVRAVEQRLAETAATIQLIESIAFLRDGPQAPNAQPGMWVEGGAFARVRDSAAMLGRLSGREAGDQSARYLVGRAWQRGDSRAVIVHACRLLQSLQADGPTGAVLAKIREVGAALGRGDPIGEVTAVLTAQAARNLLQQPSWYVG